MTGTDPTEKLWRDILTGQEPGLLRTRAIFNRIPSDPRCKMCASPFGGAGGALVRLLGHSRAPRNPMMCWACARDLKKHPGGAEIDLSVLFADVRGSTTVAEHMSATAYKNLLHRFYRLASEAITTHDGIVDKYLGDGVMALFIPAFAGEDHASRAVEAARALRQTLTAMPEPRLPVGIGVHSGTAFVGVVGAGDDSDFSALGDVVNVTARLGSSAAAGEVLMSIATAEAARVPVETATRRQMELKGRSERLDTIAL